MTTLDDHHSIPTVHYIQIDLNFEFSASHNGDKLGGGGICPGRFCPQGFLSYRVNLLGVNVVGFISEVNIQGVSVLSPLEWLMNGQELYVCKHGIVCVEDSFEAVQYIQLF